MGTPKQRALPLVLTLSACNAVLGIEPLRDDLPPDASVTSRESPNESGGSDAAADSGGGGAGGESGAGGEGGKRAAAAGRTAAAAGGTGGAPSHTATAGMGGVTAPMSAGGGAAAPSGEPVRGRIVDYRHLPVPNATVRIGDQTVQSDSEGQFEIANVPATYTVTVTLTVSIFNSQARLAWQVEGLTRRDPTVQVYRALPRSAAQVTLELTNVSFPLSMTQRVMTTWTSPHGDFSYEASAAATITDFEWVGPGRSPGVAHALLYEVEGDPELPTAYTAYQAKPLDLTSGAEVPLAFDLAEQRIATATVSGSVAGIKQNRNVRVYLRDDSDTALELLTDYNGPETFSYLVPTIPGTELAISTQDQANGRNQGLSAAFVDHVMAGQSNIALTLPDVTRLIAPGDATSGVDASTLFRWNGSAKVFLLCATSMLNYDRACVLTTKQEAHLPFAPSSDFVPAAASGYTWTVETHDQHGTVDDATSDSGYLSAYATGRIMGPRRGAGLYTQSAERFFTTAP